MFKMQHNDESICDDDHRRNNNNNNNNNNYNYKQNTNSCGTNEIHDEISLISLEVKKQQTLHHLHHNKQQWNDTKQPPLQSIQWNPSTDECDSIYTTNSTDNSSSIIPSSCPIPPLVESNHHHHTITTDDKEMKMDHHKEQNIWSINRIKRLFQSLHHWNQQSSLPPSSSITTPPWTRKKKCMLLLLCFVVTMMLVITLLTTLAFLKLKEKNRKQSSSYQNWYDDRIPTRNIPNEPSLSSITGSISNPPTVLPSIKPYLLQPTEIPIRFSPSVLPSIIPSSLPTTIVPSFRTSSLPSYHPSIVPLITPLPTSDPTLILSYQPSIPPTTHVTSLPTTTTTTIFSDHHVTNLSFCVSTTTLPMLQHVSYDNEFVIQLGNAAYRIPSSSSSLLTSSNRHSQQQQQQQQLCQFNDYKNVASILRLSPVPVFVLRKYNFYFIFVCVELYFILAFSNAYLFINKFHDVILVEVSIRLKIQLTK
jgi:hypothetical protein